MDLSQLTESEIEVLVQKHPLPEGVDDVVMNREELADALATSLPTITAWIGQGMPVLQTGGQGKAYELRLSHCWAWRTAKKRDEDLRSQKVRDATAKMRLALVGGASGDSIEALDPKTRREIIAAQREQEAFQADRNQLLKREDVRELLEDMFAMVRDVMESAPDQVERVTDLPPKVVDELIGVCDGLVEEFGRRIDSFWTSKRERPDYLKGDLFDA